MILKLVAASNAVQLEKILGNINAGDFNCHCRSPSNARLKEEKRTFNPISNGMSVSRLYRLSI